MKLSAYAKKIGIHYNTAYSHFRAGLIAGAFRLPTGTIIVPDNFQDISNVNSKPQPANSNKYRPCKKDLN